MTITPDTLSHAMVLETSADKLIERLSNELDAANDATEHWFNRWWQQSAKTCSMQYQVSTLRAERDMLATRAAAQAHEIARLMGELQKLQPAKPEPEVWRHRQRHLRNAAKWRQMTPCPYCGGRTNANQHIRKCPTCGNIDELDRNYNLEDLPCDATASMTSKSCSASRQPAASSPRMVLFRNLTSRTARRST